jgi:pSer/pThr/pTyr-binding forkhead associated (FHA) protein
MLDSVAEDATEHPASTATAPADPAGHTAPAQLVINRGPSTGARFPLTDHTTIGRYSNCDIVLDHVTVSRHHADLDRDGHRYVLTDTGSLNGTYLNRHPVGEPAVVGEGDEIRIGIFRLTVHIAP